MRKICYPMGYETTWNKPTTGNTKTQGHIDAAIWENVSVRRSHFERFFKLGGAMEPNPSEKRTEGTETETDSWSPSTTVRFQETKVKTASDKRTAGSWVRHQSVDTETHWCVDPEAFWRELPHGAYMEVDVERLELELAETRAASSPTGRECHRLLDEKQMVAYKKKPKFLKLIWLFLMKAVSSSFPMSAKPGLQWDRLQFCGTVTSGTEFLLFPVSQFPPTANILASMSNSIPSTLLVTKLSDSFATCCAICMDMWCFSGMEEASIGVRSLRTFSTISADSMYIDSPLMLPNSTQTSLSGQKPSTPCPMVIPKIFQSSEQNYAAQSIGSEIHNDFFGLAFVLQPCPGNNLLCIHYLCESQ